MRWLLLGILLMTSGAVAAAAEPTLVEHVRGWVTRPTSTETLSLASASYMPTAAERPFFERLPSTEKTNGDMFGGDYSITGKVGAAIGWFGIVRRVEEVAATGQTQLLVEHKYFDGMTDSHLLALSFHGAGDFTATLDGTSHGIRPLNLIRVYGTVEAEADGVPRVRAPYVREWDWGTFTFIDAYGTQKGNSEWLRRCQVPKESIYNAWPDERYYEERLGSRDGEGPDSVPGS